jgi:eukaryotic-like serine/threonine-protein kinase
MEKRKVKLKDLVADIHAGFDLAALADKHQVPSDKLMSFLKQCVQSEVLHHKDIEKLLSSPKEVRTSPSSGLFRANPQRTSVYRTKGVHELRGVKWKFNTGGAIDSSPVIADGFVCISNNAGHLFVVDIDTGQKRWQFRLGQFACSPPAVAQGLVFCFSEDALEGHLHAVRLEDGREKWRKEIDRSICGSSPLVVDGVVYVGNSKNESNIDYIESQALDANTGKQKWLFRRRSKIVQGLLVDTSHALLSGVVFFAGRDGYMYAVDSATGKERWRFDEGIIGDEMGVVSAHPVEADCLYLTVGRYLYSIDVTTGTEKWRLKIRSGCHSDLAVLDGVVYFGAGKNFLYAIDTRTGRARWKFKTAKMAGPPSIADGMVYFGSYDCYFYAVGVDNGKEVWKFKTEGVVRCSPAVDDGIVYFGSNDGYLYALT